MRERDEGGPPQGVYARIAAEQRVKHAVRPPPAYVRWIGSLLLLAILGAVLLAAFRVSPW